MSQGRTHKEKVRAEKHQEEHNDQPGQTPLELVRQQQALQQENKEVQNQRADEINEVPGQGKPNERMHHPQRILY